MGLLPQGVLLEAAQAGCHGPVWARVGTYTPAMLCVCAGWLGTLTAGRHMLTTPFFGPLILGAAAAAAGPTALPPFQERCFASSPLWPNSDAQGLSSLLTVGSQAVLPVACFVGYPPSIRQYVCCCTAAARRHTPEGGGQRREGTFNCAALCKLLLLEVLGSPPALQRQWRCGAPHSSVQTPGELQAESPQNVGVQATQKP